MLIDKKLRYVAVPGTNRLAMAGNLVRATVSYLDFESLKKDVGLCREGSIFSGFRPMRLPATDRMPSIETLPFTRRELEELGFSKFSMHLRITTVTANANILTMRQKTAR